MDWREKFILIPLVLLVFWIGVYPKPFFERIEPAVKNVINQMGRATTVEVDENYQVRTILTEVEVAGDQITYEMEEPNDE